MPEFFSFIEQEDYLPFFLELNPQSLPQEIGLYIGDECKGAAVVNQNQAEEAICQVNAYLLEESEENWQEELEIVFYFGERSGIKAVEEYAVYQAEQQEYYLDDLRLVDLVNKDQVTISLRDQEYPKATATEMNFRSHNYPNPFNPSKAGRCPTTNIYYSLPQTAKTSLEIYNIKGQKVKTLVNGLVEQGEHQAIWDGTDDNQNSVNSGIYSYRLQSGENVINQKMMLMK